LPCEYDGFGLLLLEEENVIEVKKGTKSGLIDANGNIVLPFQFDDLYNFGGMSDKLLYAKKNGKYGLINADGGIVVPCEFDELKPFYTPLIHVTKGEKEGLFDENGNIIVPCEFDGIYGLSDTLFEANKNGKSGVIDANGNIVLPFEFDGLNAITDTLFTAIKNGKTGIIDPVGNIILPFEYDRISQSGNYLILRKNGKYGFAKFTEYADITIPAFDITINGGKIENTNAKYPCILYNNITYFPMTYSGARSLGLSSDWNTLSGLVIKKTGTEPSVCEFEQSPVSNSSGETATIATGKITVNGSSIDNSYEEYPLLLFRDVTYFPLTWRFAVEEFGWSYSFSTERGLEISCN